MMVYYSKEELQSATAVSRNFGNLLDMLRNKQLEKIAVLRNNKMEAVLISLEEYEMLNELRQLQEHIEISQIIDKRKPLDLKDAIPFEEILSEYGINSDEL